jgi:hypothetical protein
MIPVPAAVNFIGTLFPGVVTAGESLPVSSSSNQISVLPDLCEENAIRFPSGEKQASLPQPLSRGSCLAWPMRFAWFGSSLKLQKLTLMVIEEKTTEVEACRAYFRHVNSHDCA